MPIQREMPAVQVNRSLDRQSREAREADASWTRVGSGKRRLDFIDVLRAVAVFAVFSLHIRGYWVDPGTDPTGVAFVFDRIAAQGAAGVDLFVVLSGFCMMYPLIRDR